MTPEPEEGSQRPEAEIHADQELAAQTLAMTVLAPLNFLGPEGAALAAVATPIVMHIASFVAIRISERRVKHAAETVLDAAEAAELPLNEFIDQAVSNDRRHELLARTLFIAQDTASREKRRALGRALAAGIINDDAKIDEELLFIRAVADVDEMHIRLLGRMDGPSPGADGTGFWSVRLLEGLPGLGYAVLPLLGTLELHGLVTSEIRSRVIPSAASSYTVYSITPAGHYFLRRLATDAETATE